jgi:hypothetical protein
MYAPDLNIITLVRYGYHGMGADSSTTLIHLSSGARLVVNGFIESTPTRNLLLRDGSGFLYEGGDMAMIRVTERGFESVGGHFVDYVFEPAWVSSTCVEFRRLPSPTDSDLSLVQNPEGRWRSREGRCS